MPIPNHHGQGFRVYDLPEADEKWPLRRWCGKVPHGVPVLVLDEYRSEVKLLLEDGRVGWLRGEFLRVVS